MLKESKSTELQLGHKDLFLEINFRGIKKIKT